MTKQMKEYAKLLERKRARKAAQMLYHAKQLGRVASFLMHHQEDGWTDEMINMFTAVRFAVWEKRSQAKRLLEKGDKLYWDDYPHPPWQWRDCLEKE